MKRLKYFVIAAVLLALIIIPQTALAAGMYYRPLNTPEAVEDYNPKTEGGAVKSYYAVFTVLESYRGQSAWEKIQPLGNSPAQSGHEWMLIKVKAELPADKNANAPSSACEFGRDSFRYRYKSSSWSGESIDSPQFATLGGSYTEFGGSISAGESPLIGYIGIQVQTSKDLYLEIMRTEYWHLLETYIPTGWLVSCSPSGNLAPGGTNRIIMDFSLKAPTAAYTAMKIFNGSGQMVYHSAPAGTYTSGDSLTFTWDGKASADNTAGLTPGSYVPVSGSGTPYTVRLNASNNAGGSASEAFDLRLFTPPTVSECSVSQGVITVSVNGSDKSDISFKLDRYSDAKVELRDNAGNTAAVYPLKGITPDMTQTVSFDGKATQENNLGLAPGEYVEPGQYRVFITAGSTVKDTELSIEVRTTKPSVSSEALSPAAGFVPGSGNSLSLSFELETPTKADMEMRVYTSDGKVAARLPYYGNKSGKYKLTWDGKATAGNEAGFPAGQYVPANRQYIVKALAVNAAGFDLGSGVAIDFMPVTPPVIAQAVLHDASYGLTPGGTNAIKFTYWLATNEDAVCGMEVYNAAGQKVAVMYSGTQRSGLKTYYWDGKATAGNEAGLQAGAIVPVNATYTVKAVASNSAGTTFGNPISLRVHSSASIASVSISPAKFKAVSSGRNSAKISWRQNRYSNVEVRIYGYDGKHKGKLVAVYKFTKAANYASSAARYSVRWNGKATAGNTAKLKAGALVAAANYQVKIVIGNTVYTCPQKIKVKR